MAEKCLLLEEEKVEKYYPHNLFLLIKAADSCGLLFVMEGILEPRRGLVSVKHTESLKKNFQFRFVYHRGRSIANRHLVLYFIKNGTQGNRLGISVSKKVGKSVVRSHVTRLIRESYRSMEEEMKLGYDLVVIARVSCADVSYHEVCRSLRHLLKKQQLFLTVSEREGRQEEKIAETGNEMK